MVRRRGPTWKPRSVDYRRVFDEQNPWFRDGRVPEELAQQVERPLAQQLWKRVVADSPHRFHLVIGPRRVGKTTCLYQTVRHLLREGFDRNRVWWLRLDHPLLMEVPLNVLVNMVVENIEATRAKPAFLFLDEISYAPNWDLWLKTFFDDHWPVQITGSSSGTAILRDRRMESGVGRWEEQYLGPYLFAEFLALLKSRVEIPVAATLAETIDACVSANIPLENLEALRHRLMVTGGFPELLTLLRHDRADDEGTLLRSQRTLRSDAVERAVYKDIPQTFSVDNPLKLERLLYTLAGQITGILSPSSICQDLGLSQPTFDKYLSYLVEALLVFTLSNYSGSEAKRQRRGRKLYFVDGAVRNAALQRGVAPLKDPNEMGLLLENLVAAHLHALSQHSQVPLYHWREGRDEVDLIYDHPDHPLAFEIASSPNHDRYGLFKLVQQFPRFEGRCYLVAPHTTPSRPSRNLDGIGTLPLDLLLLAIGEQAQFHAARRLSAT